MDHFADADRRAGAGAVLDDEGLAEPLRQPLPDQAAVDVGRPAGRKADDQTYRMVRIIERRGVARQGRDRSRCRGELQEIATGKSAHGPTRGN